MEDWDPVYDYVFYVFLFVAWHCGSRHLRLGSGGFVEVAEGLGFLRVGRVFGDL